MFSIIVYFTFKNIKIYCLDIELTQDYGKRATKQETELRVAHPAELVAEGQA